MGVMACSRSNCPHIMCDRMVLGNRYYICYQCFEELVHYKNSRWSPEMKPEDVAPAIEYFMGTNVGHYKKGSNPEVDAEFERLTTNCEDRYG